MFHIHIKLRIKTSLFHFNIRIFIDKNILQMRNMVICLMMLTLRSLSDHHRGIRILGNHFLIVA